MLTEQIENFYTGVMIIFLVFTMAEILIYLMPLTDTIKRISLGIYSLYATFTTMLIVMPFLD